MFLNESTNGRVWKWINQRANQRWTMRLWKAAIYNCHDIWSLPFDCLQKKIIALFIDGVKLSTLKRLGQRGLINRFDSCSQFSELLRAGGIKYIPLLLYKCTKPSRQTQSSKLMAIKTPTARTDRDIKRWHQMQHAIQPNKKVRR